MSTTPPTLPPEQPATPNLPAAPPNNVLTQDDLTMGMLAHLVAILAGIIGAVIMYCVCKERSPFIQHHTKEALNFQITLIIIELGGALLTAIVSLIIGTTVDLAIAGFVLIIIVPLLMVVMILFLVFEIMACIAAHKGEWHRYPWSIRFIK